MCQPSAGWAAVSIINSLADGVSGDGEAPKLPQVLTAQFTRLWEPYSQKWTSDQMSRRMRSCYSLSGWLQPRYLRRFNTNRNTRLPVADENLKPTWHRGCENDALSYRVYLKTHTPNTAHGVSLTRKLQIQSLTGSGGNCVTCKHCQKGSSCGNHLVGCSCVQVGVSGSCGPQL